MTQTHDTEVVGRAVYLEFTKPNMTTQVLITPEGMSTSHKMVPMAMYRRKLTKVHPRKTWNVGSSPVTSSMILSRSAALEPADRPAAVVREMLGLVRPLLDQLQLNSWSLYKDPIIVEVTKEDLEMVRSAKTPYKILGRINKTRKALGFPTEIIHPVGPAVSAV